VLTFQIVLFFSFNSDYQMVIDAQVVLTVEGPDEDPVQELLYPPRHQITLPLNNLNFIFESCEVSFNQTTKLTSDKYDTPPFPARNSLSCVCVCVCRNYFLDWDGWGYMSALEQNFNPSPEDIKRREALGTRVV
jgi:hypothetical protein